ncbi:MAG: hypothetical protein KKG09_05005 [Verrucomicrobia bacterium]|nr:hypothetical protein [Verrucomicrobiota bacterium]MBU4292401.1 hypothetical protein [Verrucomicrobiota bacterium]MBU4429779.1 hypothetical protein [Verrucomicrobiota bacterium]MBU4497344.1 hypothetical protein [Verrucomicrobiota bacterium]MCG2679824.1 hypothetical protein [Kiritimatiellia bacterium]
MDVLYTKYNYHRLPPFQVATSIVLNEGRKRVIKRALTPQATAHIARIRRDHRLFGDTTVKGGFELADLQDEGETAVGYNFIEGSSLDGLLFQAFQDGDRDRYWALMDDYVRRLRTGFKTVPRPPRDGQTEIEQVFGRSDFGFVPEAPDAYLALSAIDLIFDNVILAGTRHVLVDNEWVFSGCVPVGYVIYRALFEFYELKWRECGIDRFVSFQTAARRYGLEDTALAAYRDMEDNFQTYVCGAQRANFNLRYLKRVETIPHMQDVITQQARRIHDQDAALQDLTNKAMVLDEILNSYGYRMLSAGCRMIDRALPPETRRRRWVGKLFHGITAVEKRARKLRNPD